MAEYSLTHGPNATPSYLYQQPQAPEAAQVSIQIRCPHTEHTTHYRDYFTLAVHRVQTQSTLLAQIISNDPSPVIVLEPTGHEPYSCFVIEALLKAWINLEYRPASCGEKASKEDEFHQLLQLSYGIWDYGCATGLFEPFARRVWTEQFRDHSVQRTPNAHEKSKQWAFIALVFDLKNGFGQTVMDVLELPFFEPPRSATRQLLGDAMDTQALYEVVRKYIKRI